MHPLYIIKISPILLKTKRQHLYANYTQFFSSLLSYTMATILSGLDLKNLTQ